MLNLNYIIKNFLKLVVENYFKNFYIIKIKLLKKKLNI